MHGRRGGRVEADELLVLVAGGDQKAFEELYGLVSGPVFVTLKP